MLRSTQIREVGYQVYERLKDKILNLEFVLGEKINLKSLCEELNVSITPVREALKKLSEDGLVIFKPRQGYYVYAPTPEDIQEIYELRKILEQAALAYLKKNTYDLHPFKELRKKIVSIKNLSTGEKRGKFAETEDIHTLIIYSLNNHRVRHIYRNLHNFILLFQHLIQRDATTTTDEGLEEHLDLVNAILCRDINKARRIIEKHNSTATRILCNLIQKQREFYDSKTRD